VYLLPKDLRSPQNIEDPKAKPGLVVASVPDGLRLF
jgi:hypothetical protein